MKAKSYYKPTPIKMRKLGDALLAVSTTLSTIGVLTNHPYVAVAVLVTGVVGKFLTNFYSDEKPEKEEQDLPEHTSES